MFLGVFGLYLATLAPSVTFWDSGELAAAAFTLGIPHQPGYPLFCTLGRLFGFIPAGSAAYRLNLLSAFFASFTVLVVFYAIIEVTRRINTGQEHALDTRANVILAAALALMLGVSRVFWSQAVVTEVYALNAFFVAALVHLYVKRINGGLSSDRYIALSGFVFGLGLVNHVSLVLYLPALVLGWALTAERSGRIRSFVTGVFFIALGLSVLVYLPVRSAAGPALGIGRPDTLPGFFWVIKWHDYVNNARWIAGSASGLIGRAAHWDWRLAAGLAALAAAVWIFVRENARLYLPQLVFLGLYVAVVSAQVLGSERDIRFGLPPKFFIPAFIMAAVLAGGLAGSLTGGGRRRYLLYAVIAVFALSVPVTAYRNIRPNDMSQNFMAFDYASNSLKSVGEKGVLLTWGDNGVFPLWYMRTVEHYRDDTVLVHTPLMTYDWYLYDVRRWMGGRPEFMSGYFLGENVYRLLKAAGPDRTFCYDYSATRFLKLDESSLKVRGLVYFEGPAPETDPWPSYVFRGVSDPRVFKSEMDSNIIEIYRYQARVSGHVPAELSERP